MKITAVGLYLWVLMASSLVPMMCSSLYGNETDRLSLLQCKKAISLDPQQALMSWNDSNHVCSWEGVKCRMKTPRRVISLDLTNRGLVGQISPSLGNLTFLRYLSLPTNSFTGDIPLSLGHLHHLEALNLSKNTLQGNIPDFTNCSNLKIIGLGGNQLVGQFNNNFPARLQELILTANDITGTIPSSLVNITSLQVLSITNNSIKGNIPHEFSGFPNLQILYAGANKLAGGFPEAIMNLSTLTGLSLAFNNLSGEVPSNLFDFLPQIELFELDSNLFRGHIPNSLGNASKLQYVDISRNNFSGVIPGTIGKLTELYRLNLENNQLHARNKQDWEFMSCLANCTGLTLFSVSDNCLEGHVPSSLGNLSVQLEQLLLGGNQLSGGFPSGFQYLRNMITISIDHNKFSGVLPEWLGSLQKLQEIGLYNNYFTGIIPSSFSNLSELGYLHLASNQFHGHLLPSLENHRMLQELTIGYNNIQGMVPKEIFTIPTIMLIDLSFNNLDGSLPIEVGNAKQLAHLSLSSNKLTGDIPSTLGNCESLEEIMLDQNIFSGSIPTSLGNILSLKVLNLSQNNLSGSIPPSLGNLQFLEKLDLSFNHLKGKVPVKGILKNASAMRIDGNEALCGGVPELHLQACSVIAFNSTKNKQSIVLKIIIPLASMLSLAMVISILLLLNRKQNRKSVHLPSFGRKFVKVSYNDLAKATEGFSASNLIGRGSYSSVYQGKLMDKKVVAVKVFNLETMGAQKSFITECNALRKVRHRNIVPILTACASTSSNGNDFKALLYEFMPQGDLNKLLYSTGTEENYCPGSAWRSAVPQEFNKEKHDNHITFAQRLRIIVDVADAMEYLHHNNQETIVHSDLKPSNILLDDNMIAHVGDFGLARFKIDFIVSCPDDSNSMYSTAIKGTIGYVAPEYAAGAEVSTYGDVYSFGVVLLEIFLRKRPTDDMFKDGLDIVKFVEMNFPDRLSQIVDPELLQETHVGIKERVLCCLNSVLNIGLCCTKTSPYERMDMREVAARLSKIKEAYLIGN